MKKTMSKKVFQRLCGMILSGVILFTAMLGANLACAVSYDLSPGLVIIKNKLELKKCGVINCDISFTSEEFTKHISGTTGDSKPEFITLVSLPSPANATLKLAGRDVVAGQSISMNNLDLLRYVPCVNTASVDGFEFTVDGGKKEHALSCIVSILSELNVAPESKAQSVSVVESSEIIKYFKAADPDGDNMVFEIIRYPENGVVTIKDEASGLFSYAPTDGFTGNDSFMYVASDIYGNQGNPTAVEINVEKGNPSIVLSDMNGHWAKNSALKICASGLMLPERTGLLSNFSPEKPVTRGDFLAMAMIITGNESKVSPDAVTTFADDSGIPANIRCYAAAAYSMGVISGYEQGGKRFFNWESTITRSEAAVILDRLIDAPSPDIHAEFADAAAVPGWASDSVQTLVSLEIMNGDGTGSISPGKLLTRAEAAELLCNAAEYLEAEQERQKKEEKNCFWSFLPFFK